MTIGQMFGVQVEDSPAGFPPDETHASGSFIVQAPSAPQHASFSGCGHGFGSQTEVAPVKPHPRSSTRLP